MVNLRNYIRSSPGMVVAGALLLAVGGAAGAGATFAARPVAVMAPVAPQKISSLANVARPWIGEPIVTVRGTIAQTFGNQFTLTDGSGQVLVNIGRHRDATDGLAVNQSVTVEGRFDNGTIEALYLIGPDGRVAALSRHGREGHERGRDRREHDRDGQRANGGVAGAPSEEGTRSTLPVSTAVPAPPQSKTAGA